MAKQLELATLLVDLADHSVLKRLGHDFRSFAGGLAPIPL